MEKETNIETVKEIALSFLYMPIKETDLSPMVVCHPIFESAFIPVKKESDLEYLTVKSSQ